MDLAASVEKSGEDVKMRLVSDALNEIGLTPYHWKLFVLNGFGYAVDSLMLIIQSIIAQQAAWEFHQDFPGGLTIATYVGLLVGAIFWGVSADIIGRKYAFDTSLLLSAVFCISAGATQSWISLAAMVSLSAFGSGGNLVLDSTVFLEYLPTKDQWLVTLMAAWWGIGNLIAGLFAWLFMPRFSCLDPKDTNESCGWKNNAGWRYMWFVCGGIVLAMSILRITIMQLRETPKYLVAQGKDEQVVETLHFIASKYNRPCSLTVARMRTCGTTKPAPKNVSQHVRGLFATPQLARSTTLIWISWTVMGLAYPLYMVFLPEYLKSRNEQLGVALQETNWRDYAITNLCAIPGPVAAGFMCKSRLFWGRRGTMVLGALLTMAFFFAYTTVRTEAQNLGFSCAISFSVNLYYSTLFAYTPESLPAAHRGTGNGIAIGLNRVMGVFSALVARFADTSTTVPIFICAALYIALAVTTACFPFEPLGASDR